MGDVDKDLQHTSSAVTLQIRLESAASNTNLLGPEYLEWKYSIALNFWITTLTLFAVLADK